MKIRLCEHNKGAKTVIQKLTEQFSALDIKLKKCAKQCKICKRQPFALIDKQSVIFNNFDELVTYIKEQ